MDFGFALDSSDIDLLNIDLSDTHLDLLDAYITSKQFVVSETSSRHLQDISSRRLQDVFSVTISRLPRRL